MRRCGGARARHAQQRAERAAEPALQRPGQPRQQPPSRRCRARPASGAGRAAGGRDDGSACVMRVILAACSDAIRRADVLAHARRSAASVILSRCGQDPIERLLRGLYSAALYLLLPVTVYHLIWRGFRQRAYFQRWNERYAVVSRLPDDDAPRDTLWLHAVSVGEVNAAAPLVNALRAAARTCACWSPRSPRPARRACARCGAMRSQHVVPAVRPAGRGRPLPRPLPSARGADHGNRAVAEPAVRLPRPRHAHLHPQRAVVGALAARLPRAGAAGRPRAAHGAHASRRSRTPMRGASCELGARAEQVLETGNLKFDVAVPDGAAGVRRAVPRAVRAIARSGSRRARTRARKPAVIAMHRRLRARFPDLLLLWAPRHPERFRAVVDHRARGRLAGGDASR